MGDQMCENLEGDTLKTKERLMVTYRVESKKIPASEFKPDPRTDKVKKLRWFRNEAQRDWRLRVWEEQGDGTFVLVALTLAANDIVEESLDQGLVDMIERPSSGDLLNGCDFVVFQSSPRIRELCGGQD
jgi:hypothetical protein